MKEYDKRRTLKTTNGLNGVAFLQFISDQKKDGNGKNHTTGKQVNFSGLRADRIGIERTASPLVGPCKHYSQGIIEEMRKNRHPQ